LARKFAGIPPATPGDPQSMARWYQAVQDNSRDNTISEEGKKRHRGRTENTENYTVSSEDAGKVIILSGSTNRTFTIGADTVVQNDRGRFRQEGTGVITIVGASGTNLRINGDFNPKTRGQYAEVEWEKISPTEIILTGQLEEFITLSFITSVISTAATIVLPDNVQEGDLLVLAQKSNGTPVGSDVTPTGWTDVGATVSLLQGTTQRVSHKYKIAEGGDAGATVTGMSGTNDYKDFFLFRPTKGITTVTPASLDGFIGTTDPAAQVVTSSSGTVALAVFASYMSSTSSHSGISFSPTEDGSVANGDLDFYFKIYNSSPADVTVDLGLGGVVMALASFYLEIK